MLSFLLASLTARAFDYSDLRRLVTERDLRSVEETLPYLPEAFRSNVVLMHKSRSLQSATLEHPRAILFNDDASLVLTFTEEARGRESFEILTFADDRFAMKTIEFRDGQKAAIIEKPQNCFGCHGRMKDDLHPVWDPGLIWRGAYGAQDDLLTATEAETLKKLGGSYRALNLTRATDRTQIENRPNLRLGLLLMRQQIKRVVRLAGANLLQRLCARPAQPLALDLNLQNFLFPIYGESFTNRFMKFEAPALVETLSVLRESGVDPDEIPLTVEKRTSAAFDGSFSFRELLLGELARKSERAKQSLNRLRFLSVSESLLGLKSSPALEEIDRLGLALASDSSVALCEL